MNLCNVHGRQRWENKWLWRWWRRGLQSTESVEAICKMEGEGKFYENLNCFLLSGQSQKRQQLTLHSSSDQSSRKSPQISNVAKSQSYKLKYCGFGVLSPKVLSLSTAAAGKLCTRNSHGYWNSLPTCCTHNFPAVSRIQSEVEIRLIRARKRQPYAIGNCKIDTHLFRNNHTDLQRRWWSGW